MCVFVCVLVSVCDLLVLCWWWLSVCCCCQFVVLGDTVRTMVFCVGFLLWLALRAMFALDWVDMVDSAVECALCTVEVVCESYVWPALVCFALLLADFWVENMAKMP